MEIISLPQPLIKYGDFNKATNQRKLKDKVIQKQDTYH